MKTVFVSLYATILLHGWILMVSWSDVVKSICRFKLHTLSFIMTFKDDLEWSWQICWLLKKPVGLIVLWKESPLLSDFR